MSHEYLFDFTLRVAARIRASSEEDARRKLRRIFDAATATVWGLDGQALTFEASQDGDAILAEVDGDSE